jgi:hypothetical protein
LDRCKGSANSKEVRFRKNCSRLSRESVRKAMVFQPLDGTRPEQVIGKVKMWAKQK